MFAIQDADDVQHERCDAVGLPLRKDVFDDVSTHNGAAAHFQVLDVAVPADSDDAAAAALNEDDADPKRIPPQSRSEEESAGSVWAIDDIASAPPISLKASKGFSVRNL